jgi:trimeric autotransporter adhesin
MKIETTSSHQPSAINYKLILAGLALGFLAFSPIVQAVSPVPDGGYPGLNTAEGQSALLSLSTGTANTAVGWFSLKSNTDGAFNTGVGAGTLLSNVGNQSTGEGVNNTAIGAATLLLNTTGFDNTANGAFALLSNTTGHNNCAFGANALVANSTGSFNIALGWGALTANTNGEQNIAIGFDALDQATSAVGNVAIGSLALVNNTTGQANVALGSSAGISVTNATSHVICIGAFGQSVDNSCYIGNIWNQPGGSQAVYVNADGKLGALVSSRRFKDEIKPMAQASEVIYSLKPVSFRYKREIEPTRTPSVGLIAEDVEKVNPDLVVRDKEGKPYSVRYDQVNAMLLNEFLKEHRKVQDLKATVTHQQNQIQALVTTLQEVNARVDAISVPQVVATNP